jgi:hypothetical protein
VCSSDLIGAMICGQRQRLIARIKSFSTFKIIDRDGIK